MADETLVKTILDARPRSWGIAKLIKSVDVLWIDGDNDDNGR